MHGLLARLHAYWRGLRRGSRFDRDMADEMRFHLEMEAQRLTSQRGLDPREARRQAAIAFGGLEKYQGASRDVLGFTALRGVSLDVRLAARMLMKFPGLTIAGGLALALAIGVGAAWFDVTSNVLRPAVPLPDGDRLVEIEVRDAAGGSDERRILHDFLTWRRDLTLVEDIGAYRTLERNLIQGDADPQPLTVAEITSSAFRVARVAPLLGRTLIDADERPGALPVAVLGYDVWQRRFGGEAAAIGRTIQLGRATMTIVGVMPQHFAFPINHRVWVPLQLRPEGYAPLEGPGVRVFGRLAPGITQAEAYAQVTALAGRIAAASPPTHEHLRPRILAYGGESPGDRSWLELAVTHLPVLLVLVIACANVGTLIYARTATRDAEIAMRYALGASRGRIVGQLFVEALVLAAVAAAIGLVAAQIAVTWGMAAFFSAQPGGMPFWIEPGLQFTTVLYAALLTVSGAVILGALPALKVTGRKVQSQLKNMGAGGSTLRFGWVWTGAMIGQVAITVICLPPAMGATEEVVRDRIIRSRFPAERYLAVRVDLDRETPPAVAGNEVQAATTRRVEQAFEEFARRVALQPDVVAVAFGDRLPGMSPSVRRAEVETSPDQPPVPVPNMWTSAVGPGFFELFDIPLVMGRAFHDGDRAPAARTVLVNEAFARRYAGGSSPVGRRVRYVGAGESGREPWLEIVGVVRDIGLTPTDLGEAPYVFRAVSAATASPLVMGVRVSGDPASLAPRLRTLASELDATMRLGDVQSLDRLVWRVDMPNMIAGGAFTGVVALGLFLSAAGIFSLMSVSVARRTREIALRAALGASPKRLITGIFSRAALLVGSGVVAGNAVLVALVGLQDEVSVIDVADALLITSVVMLIVGLLACVVPAIRALRVDPTDALKAA